MLRGAAGNRDESNRAAMGKILVDYSDLVVFTEDDSEDENRLSILSHVLADINSEEGDGWYSVPERSYAMDLLLSRAKEGDVVLIAGKGHESKLYGSYGVRGWNDWEVLQDRLSVSSVVG